MNTLRHQWKAKEENFIKSHFLLMTDQQIAAHLKLRMPQVRSRRHMMGLRKKDYR